MGGTAASAIEAMGTAAFGFACLASTICR
jgi:hypothetical protein